MTPAEEVLAAHTPGLLVAIHVHVGGDRAMAAAVAEVLAEDGAMTAEVARRHGVGRKTLERRVQGLRSLLLDYCARTGVDARTALGMAPAAAMDEDGAGVVEEALQDAMTHLRTDPERRGFDLDFTDPGTRTPPARCR